MIDYSLAFVFLSSARLATDGQYGRGLLLQLLSKAKNTCSSDTPSTLQTTRVARHSLHCFPAQILYAIVSSFFLNQHEFLLQSQNQFYKQHFHFSVYNLEGKTVELCERLG